MFDAGPEWHVEKPAPVSQVAPESSRRRIIRVIFRYSNTTLIVLLALIALLGACRSDANEGSSEAPPRDTVLTSVDPIPAEQVPVDSGDVRMPQIRQRVLIREDSLWEEALRIHYNAIVFDGHMDTPSLMLDDGYRISDRHPAHRAHVDLPRMFEGGLDAGFFAIYVAPGYGEGEGATGRAMNMIDEVKRQVVATDSARIVLSADEVLEITKAGRKAILLGLEGGHATGGSAERLRAFYDAGVRYIGLTHINSNSFADASQAPPRWNGLNDTGRELIREMNRIGMLVDLSHTSDSTFWDALEVTTAPLMLSHSSARALVDNVRNVSDEMLRAVADNGGIVMVNFFDPVVNSQLTPDVMEEVYRRAGGRVGRLHDLWSVVYEVRRERGIGSAALTDVVDHIDHIAKTAGVDHVGLGSDFDGVFDLPSGLQDVTRLPWITYELLKRGYSEEDLYKILGGNMIRVLQEVEEAAGGRL